MTVTAEVVATISAPMTVLQVDAADTPDPLIVAVTIEQAFAKQEEIVMGNTVIFQDDAFALIFKKPADGTRRPQVASLVRVTEQTVELARPIDGPFNQSTRRCNLFLLTRTLRAGSVTGDIKSFGGILADGVNDLTGGVGTTPDNEKDSGLHAPEALWPFQYSPKRWLSPAIARMNDVGTHRHWPAHTQPVKNNERLLADTKTTGQYLFEFRRIMKWRSYGCFDFCGYGINNSCF